MILIDSREKPKAILKIQKYFDEQGIDYITNKLPFGDYMNLSNPTIIIDRKQNIAELCQNVTQQHARFKRELLLAKKSGIHLIILIEHSPDYTCLEDIKKWVNPREFLYCRRIRAKYGLHGTNGWNLYKLSTERIKSLGLAEKVSIPPVSGLQLFKTLQTIENNKIDYDVEFVFCSKNDTGKKILELLN